MISEALTSLALTFLPLPCSGSSFCLFLDLSYLAFPATPLSCLALFCTEKMYCFFIHV